MAERLGVSKIFIDEGNKTRQVIKYSGVSNSTWYNHLNKKGTDRRLENRGRLLPGYSFNQRGERVSDEAILCALKSYRSKIEFVNAGGYHKLSHYLYRDYGDIVNHKKVSKAKGKRICQNRTISGPDELWELDIGEP